VRHELRRLCPVHLVERSAENKAKSTDSQRIRIHWKPKSHRPNALRQPANDL
jgi:hypothetical protein